MAGRTTPEPRKRTSVSIDAGLAERLRKEADARLIGPGLLAEKLLEEGLGRLVPVGRLTLQSDEHDVAGAHTEPAEGDGEPSVE